MNTSSEAAVAEKAGAFAEELLGATLGFCELTVFNIGRRLGLYAALRGSAATAAELAERAGVDARYAREWLEHQAHAGVVTVANPEAEAADRTFELPEAHAVVLLDEEHPAYAGALADLPVIIGRTLEQVTVAFASGAGVPFSAYGVHDMQAAFTRPMYASALVEEWLPAVGDVDARLKAGEALTVLDVGCGEGWAAIYLAEAYPNVTVAGVDLDDASIAAARKIAADRGVADRVSFEVADVLDGCSGSYDLVTAFEVIHDLADPVGALAAMREATAANGAVFIVDERADERFEPAGDPIQRLLYTFSILHCLPAGRAAEPSAATGTVMRPAQFEAYALAAGFGSVEQLAVEHPMFRFYRPRP